MKAVAKKPRTSRIQIGVNKENYGHALLPTSKRNALLMSFVDEQNGIKKPKIEKAEQQEIVVVPILPTESRLSNKVNREKREYDKYLSVKEKLLEKRQLLRRS
jgi:hypothetical protein